jgi:hypothetical protein
MMKETAIRIKGMRGIKIQNRFHMAFKKISRLKIRIVHVSTIARLCICHINGTLIAQTRLR